MDMERFDELQQHLEKCLRIRTIDKSWVYGRFALLEESRQNYEKAIFYFEKAILSSQNDEKIKDYRQDIERCQMKMEIWKRHALGAETPTEQERGTKG
jgi:tetratricopeptide (TPR) repeat protein